MGIKACYVSGELKHQLIKGAYQIVYFTPEMILASRRWREMLIGEVYSHQLRAFIVDEAHTVKKWYVTILFHIFCKKYN